MVIVMITGAPVVIPLSLAVASVIHFASAPAVSSVSVVKYATLHRAGRQNGKEYRGNELVHVESLVNPV